MTNPANASCPFSDSGAEDAPESSALVGLTAAQKQGVLQTDGPVLILAGPGSGKTRVITRRISFLVECGIPAWQILALTFTNKAAREMRDRVIALLGEGAKSRGLTVTTFHALCARLLRRFLDEFGKDAGIALTSAFAICDTADQTALMKKTIESLNLSTSNWQPRSILGIVSTAKNDLVSADDYAKNAMDFNSRGVAKIYQAYEKAMRAANIADFDDLLLLTVKLLTKSQVVREECRRRWQYFLIDEYQDTNRAQFKIASLLAGGSVLAGQGNDATTQESNEETPLGPNICVVGDPDQSIYGWRGADISNILDFEKQYPKAKVITLGENFRSTTHILGAADSLIRNNKRRKHKDLFTSRKGGHKVEVVLCRDEHHESSLVLDWLREIKDESQQRGSGGGDASGGAAFSWKDFAVFYRTNALSRVMEDKLRDAGVPYVIARGTAYYQREEIKHALGYLRVVANPADGISLARVINTPARGIGDTSWDRVESAASELGINSIDALRLAATPGGPITGLSSRSVNAMVKFLEMLDSWNGAGTFMGGEVPTSLADLVERVIRESGLEKMYKDGKDGAEEGRLENLAELVSSAREFEENYDAGADPANDFAVPGSAGESTADDPLGGMEPDLADDESAYEDERDAETSETGDVATTGFVGSADRGLAPFGSDVAAIADGFVEPVMPPLLSMLRAYLERVTLVADADTVDPSQGAVTLMTLHAAKGLEFKGAAIIGLEEGTLPHARAAAGEAELEEERRLCFVGMTRAMERLLMTSARYRTIRGTSERCMRSRFLEELDENQVTWSEQADAVDDWGSPSHSFGGSGGQGFGTGGSAGSHSGGGSNERAGDRERGRGGGGIQVGTMVRHPQFGIGKVAAVTRGIDARARIVFRGVGEKTLVLQYARLQPIE